MRADLTKLCQGCRVRLPASVEHCPYCRKETKSTGTLALAGLRSYFPRWYAPTFDWMCGVFGFLTIVAFPVGLVWPFLEEPSATSLVVAMIAMPIAIMFGGATIAGGFVATAAGILAIVGVLVMLVRGGAPIHARSRLAPLRRSLREPAVVRVLRNVDGRTEWLRGGNRLRNISAFIATLTGVVLIVAVAFNDAPKTGEMIAAAIGLAMVCFFVSFAWWGWLWCIAFGPGWMADRITPELGPRRLRADVGPSTEGRTAFEGTIERAIGAPATTPHGERCIAWHVSGEAAHVQLDEGEIADFVLQTDDDHVVVRPGSAPASLALGEGEPFAPADDWLRDRGLHDLPLDDARLGKLSEGDRVRVHGATGEPTTLDEGYREALRAETLGDTDGRGIVIERV